MRALSTYVVDVFGQIVHISQHDIQISLYMTHDELTSIPRSNHLVGRWFMRKPLARLKGVAHSFQHSEKTRVQQLYLNIPKL